MGTKEQRIEWTIFQYDQWHLYVAQTKKGLCYVGSPGQTFEEFEGWIQRHYAPISLVENEESLMRVTQELREYFEGKRKSFSIPVDIKGTPFQEEIWKALKQIPYGQTASYSDLAQWIHRPKAVRAVGTAIGANPVLITIPCHRVIGKSGNLTGYRGGLEMKRFLLQMEASITIVIPNI
ncbi:methylated-DNA--[protein]-cysteine S-methyltransferase [Hazenella coriacea]|uniref:methylated-DNA--[protein]-cysteine S-methyltransferase n=1 Tax=Hazenella coriacea TaxID=1179467 RepID=A0A4R3LEM9_9BACL|nr:methylated-DNA--[protein]-cysteine S-methyltransferase [Hazenella coriacea]TCS96804.1 methylated-DNA-[protein]-cysteine S-methyltransferase [Hazenella coriacea]